jgi:hypothetical protein
MMVARVIRCGLVVDTVLLKGSALLWVAEERDHALSGPPNFAPYFPMPPSNLWQKAGPHEWEGAFFVADHSLRQPQFREDSSYQLFIGEQDAYEVDHLGWSGTKYGRTIAFAGKGSTPVPIPQSNESD